MTSSAIASIKIVKIDGQGSELGGIFHVRICTSAVCTAAPNETCITYVDVDDTYISFIHQSIYDAVGCVLCMSVPDLIFEYCSAKVFFTRVELNKDQEIFTTEMSFVTGTIFVPKSYYDFLAKRFAQLIKEGELEYIMCHQFQDDSDFTSKLFKEIEADLKQITDIVDVHTDVPFLCWATAAEETTILEATLQCLGAQYPHNEGEELCLLSTFMCVWHDNCNALKLLVEWIREEGSYKIDHTLNGSRTTVLMEAAKLGQHEIFDYLEHEEADLKLRDEQGQTALHLSCETGEREIVSKLLTKGVDIDAQDDNGRSPVMIAACHGYVDVFNALVSKDAKLSFSDKFNNKCLILAMGDPNFPIKFESCRKTSRLAIVKYLVETVKQNVNTHGLNGMTPVMAAVAVGQQNILNYLLSKSADITASDNDNDDCLIYACKGENLEILKNILSRKTFDVNKKGKKGLTSVMIAAANGNETMYVLLKKEKPDFSAVDDDGCSCLMYACIGRRVSIVKDMLVVHGSLINRANKDGLTPLMVVAAAGHYELLGVLIHKGANLTQGDKSGSDSLMHACISCRLPILEKLMEQEDIDVNKQYLSGVTLAIQAAKSGQTDMFSFLVQKEADTLQRDSENDDCLLHASRGGHLSVVKKLMENDGIDINRPGHNNMTPIMQAARHGHENIFNLLMKQDIDLSVCDINNDNCLAHACYGGNVAIVKRLLGLHKIYINSKGHLGMTPIMVAVAECNHEVVDLLLNHEPDLTTLDVEGNSCIMHASKSGDSEIMKKLISSDPRYIDMAKPEGLTPLMVVARMGNEVLFGILADGGADMSLVDERNNSCLHHACYGSSSLIVQSILSKTYLDINQTNNEGHTPVMISCALGEEESFRYLTEKKADVDRHDNANNSCLILACKGKNPMIVKKLVNERNVNEMGQFGSTPIMIAAGHGEEEIFDILLNGNADLSSHDEGNDHCLMHACRGSNVKILEKVLLKKRDLLDKRGHCGKTAIMLAAISGNKAIFDFLFEKEADLTLIDVNNDHCLMHACEGGNLLILDSLLSKNVHHINKRGWNGRTPLMKAADKGHIAIIDFLIENGADVSLTDDEDEDCFMIACQGQHLKLVRYLVLQYKFDVNRRGKYGIRPVLAAALLENGELFEFLMSRGADLSSTNIIEHNVLMSMCSKNNKLMEKILILTTNDINRKGFDGKTMLMESALKGHNKLVDNLLSKGAVVSLCDDYDNDSVMIGFLGCNIVIIKKLLKATTCSCMKRCNSYAKMAIKLGNEDILDFLFSMGLNISFDCLIQSCIHGQIEILTKMSTQNCLNATDSRGFTLLMASARYGQEEVFKLLLDNGALLSPENTDESNSDCLHLAALGGKVGIVETILKTNLFDINITQNHGMSPLLLAATHSHYEVFCCLEKNNADVSLTNNDNDDCLRLACLSGNLQLVRFILSLNKHDVNKKGARGLTPAMTTAKKGHMDILYTLFKNNANLRLTDDDNNDCLMLACIANQLEIVKTLLSWNICDINRQGQSGMTPLMAAAGTGNWCLFNVLLSNKADIFPKLDANGFDCLLHAARGGNVVILDKLLSYEAFNVNVTANCGTTPVLQAAENNHWEVIFSLQRKGANLDLKDEMKDNCFVKSCRNGNSGLLRQLLRIHDFDIDAETDSGWTPAMIAASKGHLHVLKFLAMKGAFLVKLNCDGNDCLMIACIKEQLDVVRFLLSLNIYDINRCGENGWTPLLAAANYGHGKLFELLLSEGALLCGYGCKISDLLRLSLKGGNVSIVKHILSTVNVNPETPLETIPVLFSAHQGQYDVFKMLVEKGASMIELDKNGDDCLRVACKGGSQEIVDYLLKQNRSFERPLFDVNRRGNGGLTPLMTAALEGHLAIFILLLKAGACVSVTGKDGNNCLMLACMKGNLSIIRYILKENLLPVNQRGHCYETPLMAASIQGNVGTFHLLLSWGADLNMRNEDNNNCLMLASLSNNIGIVRFIVTISGYDINAKGQYGMTPLMVATGSKKSALFKTLFSAGAVLYLRDDNGKSCAEYAYEEGNIRLHQNLMSKKETVIYTRNS